MLTKKATAVILTEEKYSFKAKLWWLLPKGEMNDRAKSRTVHCTQNVAPIRFKKKKKLRGILCFLF